jgi:hypothetical protein
MKGAAQYWLDALRPDPRDGKLVVTPSYSPEHGQFTAGAAMSQTLTIRSDIFSGAFAVVTNEGALEMATSGTGPVRNFQAPAGRTVRIFRRP